MLYKVRASERESLTNHEARLVAALARLDSLVNWERMKRSAGTVFSLDPARDLCARLGNPQQKMRCVHVAGTKAKGSTAALISAGMRAAGLSEALYTSPHVVRLRERLRVRGEDVDAGALALALERALAAHADAIAAESPGCRATWFDVLTCACFLAAADSGATWLVAECGLGGRLDSTNVIAGEVCVITNIELEHQAVLGATRALIAGEKAGILKPGSTLVTGVPADDEAGRVIDARAKELSVAVLRPLGGDWDKARIEERNLALAGAVLDELGRRGVLGANSAALQRNLLDLRARSAAKLPGRLEWFLQNDIPVALDGGHVPASIRDVLRDLGASAGRSAAPVVILGLARDKDLPGVLKAVSGATDRVVCTSVGSDLHFTPYEIAMEAEQVGLVAETAATPQDALRRALVLARNGGWVLATGSLYLAGSLRTQMMTVDTRPGC